MKKLTAFLMCIVLLLPTAALFSSASDICTSCGGKCGKSPSIVIPGLFQSEVLCYDENGEIMLDSNGEPRVGPFFMDTSETVINAVKKVLLPLSKTLITQKDKQHEFANALADVLGEALMERVKSDDNGNFVHDVRAVQYTTSMAKMNEHDKKWALDAIPLKGYIDVAGEDHLYFFSYSSLDNMERLAKQVKELIEQAKAETGHDKVNVVPISQGGSIFNAVMEYYPELADDIDRVVYVVPAVDGSSLIGDIYANGFIDDDDALYDYMFPILMGEGSEWLGYLIDIIIRVLPKEVLNDTLDIAVDKLIGDYLVNSTALWGLIPSGSYPAAREKYLTDDSKSVIREQTDRYYKAQLNAKENILKFRESGVEFFDIVGYNKALYPIVDSWNKVNADGIIQLSSTSLGATSAKVGEKLPDGYTQGGNAYGTCSDKTHSHIDPRGMVDASTGLLPDHTFYFYNHDHEKTGGCDVIINLAIRLLWDKSFKDVYSYPDEYPQFNDSRFTKWLISSVDSMRNYDLSSLSAQDAEELKAAIAQVDEALSTTVVDGEAFKAAEERFYAIRDKINSQSKSEQDIGKESTKALFMRILTKLLSIANKVINRFFGNKGFSDR